MSGRLTDSNRVKHGEIVDADLMELTENYGEGATSMKLASEYKVRRDMEKKMGVAEESSDEEEEKKPMESSMEKKEKGKETPGRSEAFSKYLAKLPGREAKMMKERDAVFGGRGRRGRKLEIAKHKEGERHEYPAEDAMKLRKEVLSVSLFPNLYNRTNLLHAM